MKYIFNIDYNPSAFTYSPSCYGSRRKVPVVSRVDIEKMLVYLKADVLHRCIAKFIDLLIVAAIYQIPLPVSFIGGITYLLLADGFWEGRSVGKRLIGLQTMRVPAGQKAASFRASIIRNFPLAVAYLLFPLPYVGKPAAFMIVLFEGLLMIGNDRGVRVGDELGQTHILDHATFESIEK